MNINNGNSVKNTNIIKTDVSDILLARSAGISTFLHKALQNGQRLAYYSPAKSYKHEWVNVVTKPKFFTVASSDNGAKTITFKEKAPEQNYILSIDDVNVLVKSVSGLVATVEILTEDGDISNLTDKVANIVSEGTPEGRKFTDGQFQSGDIEYNYTQIFDEGYVITGSMLQMDAYANLNKIEVQQMFAIDRYLKKLSNASLRGSRYNTEVAGKRVSSMGGLKTFVNSKGGNVLEVTGGNVTYEDFCKMMEIISTAGGDIKNLEVYVNLKWAPTINKLNNITAGVKDNERGGIPEFLLLPGGGKIPVIFDSEFLENEIYFINKDGYGLVPLGDRNGYFTEPKNDADEISSSLIAEYTLVVRNAKIDHGVIVISE